MIMIEFVFRIEFIIAILVTGNWLFTAHQKAHCTNIAPKVAINIPVVKKNFTPDFATSNPPRIDKKRPGIATSHIRLLAEVKLNPYSAIIKGSRGGIACMEKRKANMVKKLVKRILCRST